VANTKISALTAATTPLAGTEVLPIVQSGATVKVANNDLRPKQIQSNATSGVLQIAGPAAAATRTMTVPDANFTVARTDAANSFTADQTLATGNLVQGTAAKGINFTANTPAAGMTSQLLNWYEEGTWTPVLRGSGTAGTYQTATAIGRYTRIGRQVTLQCYLELDAVITGGGTGYAQLTGMPYAKAGDTTFPTGALLTIGVDWTAGTPLVAPITSGSTSILYFPEIVDNAALNSIQISGFSAQDTLAFTLTYNAA
jgi:hypothetical protein